MIVTEQTIVRGDQLGSRWQTDDQRAERGAPWTDLCDKHTGLILRRRVRHSTLGRQVRGFFWAEGGVAEPGGKLEQRVREARSALREPRSGVSSRASHDPQASLRP